MTRRLVVLGACLLLIAGAALRAYADSFTLSTGETIEGEPVSFLGTGLVLKKADGTFATRVPWTNFTQNALKELAKNPKAKPFVEAYVDPDEAEESLKKAVIEVKPRIPDRLDRPDPKAGFGALFSSPLALSLFLLLYLANIYAGFEIAIFRNYPIALVCGIAAVAPVLGPALFVCLPPRLQKTQDELAAESMAKHQAEADAQAAAYAAAHPEEAAEAPEAAAPVETGPQATVYLRGQTTFNRRFFETKFAGFLRMVPGEAEKDMVIYIRSSRGEHVGARLTRIQPNDLSLQINKAGATSEVMIPFAEIMEIQVRHKDAVPAPTA